MDWRRVVYSVEPTEAWVPVLPHIKISSVKAGWTREMFITGLSMMIAR
jgi:hypothetical protein